MKKDFESFIERHRQEIQDDGFSDKVHGKIVDLEDRKIPGRVRTALCSVLVLLFVGALWLCGWGIFSSEMSAYSLILILSSGAVGASSLWLISDIA